jgi:hypothetical protein
LVAVALEDLLVEDLLVAAALEVHGKLNFMRCNLIMLEK